MGLSGRSNHRSDDLSAPIVEGTEDGLGWCVEVSHSRALTEELRVVTKPEIDPDPLARGGLEDGNHDLTGGPRKDGRADHHNEVARVLSQS